VHEDLAREPAFVDMLLEEARLAALVKHPNVVDIYELGEAAAGPRRNPGDSPGAADRPRSRARRTGPRPRRPSSPCRLPPRSSHRRPTRRTRPNTPSRRPRPPARGMPPRQVRSSRRARSPPLPVITAAVRHLSQVRSAAAAAPTSRPAS
jgi:hypothetical protein